MTILQTVRKMVPMIMIHEKWSPRTIIGSPHIKISTPLHLSQKKINLPQSDQFLAPYIKIGLPKGYVGGGGGPLEAIFMIPHCDLQDASLISRDRTDEILKSIMFPIYFCAICSDARATCAATVTTMEYACHLC